MKGRAKCEHCGKPVLPGSRFCSNSCDAGSVMNKPKASAASAPNPGIGALVAKGVRSVSVTVAATKNGKPSSWTARVSNGGNGDRVATRDDPDAALRDALHLFSQNGKRGAAVPDEDDTDDLI